jgi:Leucine-rich repeat (LRR) protein
MVPKHNDDEIIITETPRVIEIYGSGCVIRPLDLSDIKYMAHRLEIRDITLGTLGWIPEWVLEVYMENCRILPNSAVQGDRIPGSSTNLPQSVIQLTCRGCQIPDAAYSQLMTHRLIRLELINQGLTRLPQSISEFAPNLLFLNLNENSLSQPSKWPQKLRGLRLSSNKLVDLAHLGQLPPYLEDLDLSNNIFAEIPVGDLSPFLRKLNMSRNELNWLPDNPGEYPPNLRELNISGNCGLDDLTEAGFPDMLTTLIAAECEISRLPHELNSYCLTHMDLSDNNITNLDELPFDTVMNISYVGNPCWEPLDSESMDSEPMDIANQIEPVDDDNSQSGESIADSVFTSGCPSPEPIQDEQDIVGYKKDDMTEYKEAISRSSSQEELQKMNSQLIHKQTLVYPENDPLIKAIDYVVATGFNRVGSFLSIVSDILKPDTEESAESDNSGSTYASPSTNNNIHTAQALIDLDHYGIFGTFD